MPPPYYRVKQQRGCQAVVGRVSAPTDRQISSRRRWFGRQTTTSTATATSAVYYLHHLLPSIIACRATEFPPQRRYLHHHHQQQSLFGVAAPIIRSSRHQSRQWNHHHRPFSTTTTTTAGQSNFSIDDENNPKAVIAALEHLVERLDDGWEPKFDPSRSSSASTLTATESLTDASSSSTSPLSTEPAESSLSAEEYSRVFCTGYKKLPPLQLGSIAITSTSASTAELISECCPRSAILTFLAQTCGLSNHIHNTNRPSANVTAAIQQLLLLEQQSNRNHQRDTTGSNDSNDDSGNNNMIVVDSTNTSSSAALLQTLRQAWTPKYEEIFHCLLEQNSHHTISMLVDLRADLLRVVAVLSSSSSSNQKKKSAQQQAQLLKQQQLLDSLQQMERHLRRLLSAWFSPGLLEIKRITYDTTSAGIIEKIAVKEAVHPMKSLDDLRQRLGPKRRVFALFHPLLPGEPLVILHVHLETKLDHVPSTMDHVLLPEDTTTTTASTSTTTTAAATSSSTTTQTAIVPRTATFYSISNTQHGLTRGLGLGEFLIKQAVKLLRQEFPSSLGTFVTLSPLPGFRKWVESIFLPEDDDWPQRLEQHCPNFSADTIQALASARPLLLQLVQSTTPKPTAATTENDSTSNKIFQSLSSSTNNNNKISRHDIETQLEELKPTLMVLAAHYLVAAKNRRSGKPLDPVAGFHIHNGAEVCRINYAADLSRKGLLRSFGVMTNYRYRLEDIEKNKASFESSHYSQIAMSASVRNLLETSAS